MNALEGKALPALKDLFFSLPFFYLHIDGGCRFDPFIDGGLRNRTSAYVCVSGRVCVRGSSVLQL